MPKRKRETETAAADDNRKKSQRLFFFKKNDNVQTPPDLYAALDAIYHFDFDPCPLAFDQRTDPDGLTVDWGTANYVNPPFSKISAWISKGISEKSFGRMSVFIIPIRSNSLYWRDMVLPNATKLTFLPSIRFVGYKNKLPVPLALVEFDPHKQPIFAYDNNTVISGFFIG